MLNGVSGRVEVDDSCRTKTKRDGERKFVEGIREVAAVYSLNHVWSRLPSSLSRWRRSRFFTT